MPSCFLATKPPRILRNRLWVSSTHPPRGFGRSVGTTRNNPHLSLSEIHHFSWFSLSFLRLVRFTRCFVNLRKQRSLFTVTLCFNHLRRVNSRTSGSALKSVRIRLLAHAAGNHLFNVAVFSSTPHLDAHKILADTLDFEKKCTAVCVQCATKSRSVTKICEQGTFTHSYTILMTEQNRVFF